MEDAETDREAHKVMNGQITKNNLFLLVAALAAVVFAGIACSGGAADAKPAGPEFVGAWSAKDGSTITIRSDGSADYKSGSTTVSGGKAEVSEQEKTLRISLLGIGPKLKIDKPPANDEMTLDGVVYRK